MNRFDVYIQQAPGVYVDQLINGDDSAILTFDIILESTNFRLRNDQNSNGKTIANTFLNCLYF